jgi:hypothetical protein
MAILCNGTGVAGVSNSSATYPSSDHTACFFARVESTGITNTFYHMLTRAGEPSGQHLIQTSADGVTVNYKTSTLTTSLLTMVINQWYFFALVASNGNAIFYGKPVGTPTCQSVKSSCNTFTTTGAQTMIAFGTEHINTIAFQNQLVGRISGVKFWSQSILKSSEIELESTQIYPVRTHDVYDYWPFSPGSNSIISNVNTPSFGPANTIISGNGFANAPVSDPPISIYSPIKNYFDNLI